MKDSPDGTVETRRIRIDEIIIGDRGDPDIQKVHELAESISEIGLLNAITLDANYRLIAGWHRVLAYKQLDYETIRANVVDLENADRELAEIDENLIRRELTRLERSELLKRRKEIYAAKYPQTREGKGQPATTSDVPQPTLEGLDVHSPPPSFYDDTAEKLGVRPRTIERDVQIAADIPEDVRDLIRHSPIADHKDKLIALSRVEAEEQWEVASDLVSDEPKRVRKAQGRLAPLMSSASPEWYTPKLIIDRAIQVMGGIDLDPCSNSHEEPNVPAGQHYTIEDNGLAQKWHGRVYMNPPYGREIDQWAEKLCEEHKAGHIEQAIALVPARTDTSWFARFRKFPRCFIQGRLRFSGYENSAPFPSAIIALGCDLNLFVEAFGDLGDIYELVNAKRPDSHDTLFPLD